MSGIGSGLGLLLGLWLALPWVRRGLRDLPDARMWRGETAIASVILIAVLAVRFGQAESAANVAALHF